VDYLTFDYHPHILKKTTDDFESLRCSYPSLILRESTQSLEYRLDILLSKDLFLDKCFCVA